jgi:hypothetical protein
MALHYEINIMHTLDLHKIIFNESFDALQELRQGSNDKITLEERLERFVRYRLIISNIQLFDITYLKDVTEITMGFSPWYLLKHQSKILKDDLNLLVWKFKLPIYICNIEGSNDEGIDSWLSKGKVVVDKLSYDKNIVKDIYYKKIKDYFNQ